MLKPPPSSIWTIGICRLGRCTWCENPCVQADRTSDGHIGERAGTPMMIRTSGQACRRQVAGKLQLTDRSPLARRRPCRSAHILDHSRATM